MSSNVIPLRARSVVFTAAVVLGLVVLSVLIGFLLLPLPAHAQDVVQFDPADYVNLLPFSAKVKGLILISLPFLYLLLGVARRFTKPETTAGQIVRFVFDGWKHKSELPGAAPAAPPAPAPKGHAATLVLGGLAVGLALAIIALAFLPRHARAQDAVPLVDPAVIAATQPPVSVIDTSKTPPMSFELSQDLSLRLNVTVAAFQYDATHKAYLGKLPIGGLYALTSKRLLGAGVGLGGNLAIGSDQKPAGELDGAIFSPRLTLSPTLGIHAAFTAGRQFGSSASWRFGLAPTLEF